MSVPLVKVPAVDRQKGNDIGEKNLPSAPRNTVDIEVRKGIKELCRVIIPTVGRDIHADVQKPRIQRIKGLLASEPPYRKKDDPPRHKAVHNAIDLKKNLWSNIKGRFAVMKFRMGKLQIHHKGEKCQDIR